MVNDRKEKVEKKKEIVIKACVQRFPSGAESKIKPGPFKSPLSARHSVSETGRLGLGLLRRSLLGGLLGLGLASGLTVGTLVLHVLVIDVESLIDLSAEGLFIIKPR